MKKNIRLKIVILGYMSIIKTMDCQKPRAIAIVLKLLQAVSLIHPRLQGLRA